VWRAACVDPISVTKPAVAALPEVATLRSLKGKIIVVEYRSCRAHGELERKAQRKGGQSRPSI
jgi:hypothetical protein